MTLGVQHHMKLLVFSQYSVVRFYVYFFNFVFTMSTFFILLFQRFSLTILQIYQFTQQYIYQLFTSDPTGSWEQGSFPLLPPPAPFFFFP